MSMNAELASQLIEVFNDDPGFVKTTGVRITDAGDGWAAGKVEIGPQHTNLIGSVQGGVIFTLADIVAAAAAYTYGSAHTTVSSDIHFLSPAINTKTLFAKAETIKSGKRIVVLDVRVKDEKDTLISYMTLTFLNLNIPI